MSVVPPTGMIRKFYEDAIEDIEYRSSAFWQVWLQREFARDFREFEIYAVTSESSPDGSRRRVDQVVKRYDPSHHNLSSLVWNECKRRSGSSREAEDQALDAAIRCIQRENLLWIYALTTVGVTFRVWRVEKREQQLRPFKGTKYIDADSNDAWILRAAIQEIKDYFPLGDAPVLPSQSHLLEEYPEESGQSSVQETQNWPYSVSFETYGQQVMPSPAPVEGVGVQEIPQPSVPFGGYGQQEMLPPTLEDTGKQSGMQETDFGEETIGSTAAGNPVAGTVETWLKVEVRRTRHVTRRDEFTFTTSNNHVKITDRDDWTEIEHKGKQAWYYRHKGIYYYTRDKPVS